jgi:two-component system cell cycle sensor histidine kinase PleC
MRPVAEPFPLAIRVVVLAALVCLSAYTVFAGMRVNRSVGQASSANMLRSEAEHYAARIAALAAPASASLDATAILAGQGAETGPLDLAESALKLSGGKLRAAAVIRGGKSIAESGLSEGIDWTQAARELDDGGIAVSRKDGATPLLIVARSVNLKQGPVLLAAALDGSSVVSPAEEDALPADHTLLLVTHSGAITARLGPAGPLEASAKSLDELLGLSLAQLSADTGAGRETHVENKDKHKLRVSAVPVGLQGLSVVISAPGDSLAAAEQRSILGDVVSLLAPLVIGLGLAMVVFRQARKAEVNDEERREAERRFRHAVEAAHCGIWEWRLREDEVYLSDVTGVMFGWGGGGMAPGSEVLGRIAPEHVERVRNALVEAGKHGAFDVSFKVPGPNGAAWIDARGQGFGARDALGYSTIMGVALDVTQERDAQARAQSAEARLSDAIESVSEAFVLWDRRGRLVMCNKNYRDFFSLDPRVIVPGADRAAVQKLAEISIRGHQPAADGRPGAREAEMMDGRWLQISERRTSDGGAVMTAADITAVKRQEEARRRNEQALQRAVVRLEESGAELAELAYKYEQEKIRAQQANAAKSEFLANMSHELRTPLNAINGFSEMMAREMLGPIGDRYKEYSHDILASGQHLLALINDILDMAKIEAGKLSLHLEPVDLSAVADDAARLMRNRLEAGGLTLIMEMGELPTVEADMRAVKQVLLNLLSNAVKFTPRGGKIKISARAHKDRVRVSVMDTGIGIAKEDIERLARPFEQVESQHSKTQQGTGLGLALSKSLVEMHEGKLEMASEPGRGTTVSFTLPFEQRKAPTSGEADGKESAAA